MTNARYAAAFVRGMRAGGVAPTVKHFPGLGRVTNNTDTSSAGITDRTTGPADPYLEPFRAAIAAAAPMVMVSSARYPRLDAHNAAMFSRPIITGLLRGHLGFRGVVITDDVGASDSVASLPVGQRATRFIAAGGDIVLTAVAGQAGTMIDSIAAEQAQNPAFGAQVTVATGHVLDLKAHLGLVRCP
jgi:beta-N-acetylhexosaminidase